MIEAFLITLSVFGAIFALVLVVMVLNDETLSVMLASKPEPPKSIDYDIEDYDYEQIELPPRRMK